MRYRIVFALLYILPCTYMLNAQGTMKGVVSDKTTREPLPGVYIIPSGGTPSVTQDDGSYSIRIGGERTEITFKLLGYAPVTITVTLKNSETKSADIELETETQIIDQVVVSADRIEHKVSELTVSVKVIKSDFLSKNHITDAQELITKIPGIEVLDGQASIRGGSGFSYGVGSRVLALVDGLPLLTADAGGIRWQYLPMERISQVEIIKGASSVLYGSSALNGIINFLTADASNIPSTRFFSEAGLYLTPRNGSWKWWNSPRIISTTSFSHLQRSGQNDVGISLNFFTDNSYRKYNDEDLGKLSLRVKHYSKKVEGLNYGINITTGLTAKTDFLLWESADAALVQDTSSIAFLHGRFLAADPFISFRRKGNFRHDLKMRIQSSESTYPVKTQNNAGSFSIYSEYQLWYRITEKLNITGGLSETWNKIFSNFFGNHEGINIAAFSQTEFRPFNRLKLVAGIRMEQNILDSESDGLVPVFRTGLNYQAAQFTFLRASFGQGYRFPSIAEKFAATTLGSVAIIPNPYVKAESGWSSEAGIKQGIRSGKITGQADMSVFFSQNRNLIEYIFGIYPEGLGFQADNIEYARIYGTEIEFTAERKAGEFNLSASGGYTFIYPVEFNAYTNLSSDTYLKYRRKHSAKLSVNASRKRIDANISMFLKSKILNIDDVFLLPSTREQILPGFYNYWLENNKCYFLADISIGYRISRVITLSAAVKNFTNTEYMGRPGDIQPPITASFRLTATF